MVVTLIMAYFIMSFIHCLEPFNTKKMKKKTAKGVILEVKIMKKKN